LAGSLAGLFQRSWLNVNESAPQPRRLSPSTSRS
jgi:hypothetical protein